MMEKDRVVEFFTCWLNFGSAPIAVPDPAQPIQQGEGGLLLACELTSMSSVCGCFGRFWCLRTRSSSAKSRRSRTYLKLTLIGNQCFLSANGHFQCTAGYKCALQVPSQGTNYSLVLTTRFLLKGVLQGNLVLLKVNMSTSFPSSYFVAR